VVAVVVVVALIFVLAARTIAGPGWRRYLGRRSTGFSRWDLLFGAANGLAVAIGAIGATGRRGDLPALLVIGLVAALPVSAVGAVRFWWWLPRQDRSADGDPDRS
jgi:hypothetical protein